MPALCMATSVRSHGNSDIGGSERRRVVDAVARHGDDMALALQLLDHLAFVFG